MGRSKIVLALAAGGVLACNAIIGLSDFEKRECAGAAPCDYDGGPDAQPDTIRPDGGGDANPDAPPGVGPVSWADFEMPNYKDDAGILPRQPDYDLTSTDFATDKITGLVWRRAVVGGNSPTLFNEAQASGECQKIKPDNWRLPKRIELVTLLASYGQSAPFIDHTAFSTVPSQKVWTSSEVRTADTITNKFWVVDFETGAVAQRAATDVALALCVKDK